MFLSSEYAFVVYFLEKVVVDVDTMMVDLLFVFDGADIKFLDGRVVVGDNSEVIESNNFPSPVEPFEWLLFFISNEEVMYFFILYE